MTITEFEAAVGEISLELPDELFNKLNGGIVVQPSAKQHKKSLPESPLFIAGEYVRAQTMRYIVIYYGSFMRLYGHESPESIRRHIREVLLHELRHHWEGLAGERGLEILDEENIAAYLDSHERTPEPEVSFEGPSFDGRVYTYGEDER